ncbi:MAG: hypothetical protein ACPGWR_30940 [Ardenticatenaceae bacterium]
MTEQNKKKKKDRMPTGMYIGSAWIGFSIFMLICWVLSFMQVNSYVKEGVGNVANFMTILICMAIFGFAIPMLIGIRTLRRAGRVAKAQQADEGS